MSQVRITDIMLILNHNVDDNNKTRLFTTAYDTYEQQLKPWPNDANIFAQQMPTMLGINVGIVWPPMLGIVG